MLKQPVYGILGNHDSIRMLPKLESDDPHYFRVDNLEKAARDIPANAVSLLLSHTSEICRQAAVSADAGLYLGGGR